MLINDEGVTVPVPAADRHGAGEMGMVCVEYLMDVLDSSGSWGGHSRVAMSVAPAAIKIDPIRHSARRCQELASADFAILSKHRVFPLKPLDVFVVVCSHTISLPQSGTPSSTPPAP